MQVRKRRGTEVTASEGEVELLEHAVQQLLVLLGEPDGEASQDPLAAMVGLTSDAERPRDPALARLLPDAYPDDEDAAREFRRYTDSDLRAGKRAHATTVLSCLADLRSGRTVLDRDQVDAWIGTVNDLRLVLGTRLGVSQDDEPALEEDDPAHQAHALYHWLGWVLEALLRTITPRR